MKKLKIKNKKFEIKKVLFSLIILGLISDFGLIGLLLSHDKPLQAAEITVVKEVGQTEGLININSQASDVMVENEDISATRINDINNASLITKIIDSDGDGYDNETEIASGYSPFNPAPVKLQESDVDADGLSDYWEIEFGTDPFKSDTDNDGYLDGDEVDRAYDPNSADFKKLDRKIEINLKTQRLTFLVAGRAWKDFSVSTGKPSMPTPTGTFKIVNKIKKAWSKSYGLWMPYWLGLDRGRIGIHELPVWPGGYREGEDHLGRPVSHGCIRLGVGPAQYLYERVEVGTEVVIK